MISSEWIDTELNNLKQKSLYRKLVQSPTNIETSSGEYINFSTNDYLNLINNNRVKKAAINAIKKWGSGSGGSRLMAGHLEIHLTAEEMVADCCNTESALVFGSGYLANYGLLTSICTKDDLIISDKLNHASLIDGMVKSDAKWVRYKHNSVADLEKKILNSNVKGKKIIVTESIFSMDGDLAPLTEIFELANRYNCWLIVDEAHAIGVLGNKGGGCLSHLNILPNERTIITGTFSKALASYGGFVASTKKIRSLLINKARSFIFSTALSPSSLGAAIESMKLIKDKNYGKELLNRASYFHQRLKQLGFNLQKFESHIIPLIIGDNEKTIQLANHLKIKKIISTAIRPPTVAVGSSRIRFSITLAHSKSMLEKAAEEIYECSKDMGLEL